MFKRNPVKYLKMTGADTIIADELHRMKDPQTQLHKVIQAVRPHVKNFIGMTATPSMNDPFEAVSLINAISRKKMSPAEFQKEFYERKADGIMDWMFGLFTHERHGPIEGFKNPAQLGKFIGANYHFAEPEMKDFPKKKIDVVRVPMTTEQTNLYKAILEKQLTAVERRILEKGEIAPTVVLQRIINKTMAARQLANNKAYPEGHIDVTTPKVLSMVVDAVKEVKHNPKGQVVMFSNFIDNGTKVLENALGQAHVPYARFTGLDAKDVRDKAVADYNAGNVRALIISGAGSEGLNLPNTTMVQMMEGHYNPERITQTEGRGIRRGGLAYLPIEKRVVKVKRYIAMPEDGSMSVDERIYDIAAKKAGLIKQFKDIVTKWQAHQQKLLARKAQVPGTKHTKGSSRA
jgi:SNF2 family DNA or RNA helicase